MNLDDLIQRFGRLTVVDLDEKRKELAKIIASDKATLCHVKEYEEVMGAIKLIRICRYGEED